MTSPLLLCVLLVTVLTASSAPLYTDVEEEVPEIKILLNDDILDGYDLLNEDLAEENIHKRSLEGLERGNLLGRSLDSLGSGNLQKRSLEGVGSGNLLGRSLYTFHDNTLDGIGNGLWKPSRKIEKIFRWSSGQKLLKKRSLDGSGGGNLLGIFFDGVKSMDRLK